VKWKYVPQEPTNDMIHAGLMERGEVITVWTAMWNAFGGPEAESAPGRTCLRMDAILQELSEFRALFEAGVSRARDNRDKFDELNDRVEKLEAEKESLTIRLNRLYSAARGGNAEKGNVELLRVVADYLLDGAPLPQGHVAKACRERAAMLQFGLDQAKGSRE